MGRQFQEMAVHHPTGSQQRLLSAAAAARGKTKPASALIAKVQERLGAREHRDDADLAADMLVKILRITGNEVHRAKMVWMRSRLLLQSSRGSSSSTSACPT